MADATKQEPEDEDALPTQPDEIVKFLHTQINGAWANFAHKAEAKEKETVTSEEIQKYLKAQQSKFSTLADAEQFCSMVNLTHQSHIEANRQAMEKAMKGGRGAAVLEEAISALSHETITKAAFTTTLIHDDFKKSRWDDAIKVVFDKIASRNGDPSEITPADMLAVLEENGDQSEEADVEDMFKEVLGDQSVDFNTARFDYASLRSMILSSLEGYIAIPEVRSKMFAGLHADDGDAYNVTWDPEKKVYNTATSGAPVAA